MLHIRKEQMDVLRAYMCRQFEQRMVKYVRGKFYNQVKDLSDEKIYTFVQYSMNKAKQYCIEYEDDIRRYIEYLVIYGTLLDAREEPQWIVDILQRDDLDGTAKMDLIDNCEMEAIRK